MRKRGRDGAGKSGGWLGVSREDGGRKTGVDRSESDQKIERKRGIEKQRTTPKVYSPRVPSTHIWPVGSLPLFSLSLSVSLSFLLWLLIPSFLLCLPWTSCQIGGCGSECATSRLDTANRCGKTAAGNKTEPRKSKTGKRTSGASLSVLYIGVIPTENEIEAMESISVLFILHLLPPPVKVEASRVGLSDWSR